MVASVIDIRIGQLEVWPPLFRVFLEGVLLRRSISARAGCVFVLGIWWSDESIVNRDENGPRNLARVVDFARLFECRGHGESSLII